MPSKLALLLAALLCAIPAAARADSFDPISVGLSASTLGFGDHAGAAAAVRLERARRDRVTLVVDRADLRQQPVGRRPFTKITCWSRLDWRPYAGRWRLSGGLLLRRRLRAKVAQSFGPNYTLNGNVYPVNQAGVVSARTSYARPAIYLGFGGGTGILKGLTIAFDAGIVVRNGTPRPARPARCKQTRSSKPILPRPPPSSAPGSSSP